jgi:hypothetical protein
VFIVIGSKANISGTCYFKVVMIGVCQNSVWQTMPPLLNFSKFITIKQMYPK